MRELIIKTVVKIAGSLQDLPANDQILMQKAIESLEHSYSPYSNFKVGAAVLLENGEMMVGSNQENAAYPLCLCAERVVLAAVSSQFPKEKIKKIAITAKSPTKVLEKPVSPCGGCRQALCEVEQRQAQDVSVMLMGERGAVYVLDNAHDLLPLSFDGTAL